jgi:SAM-dependent methyltransferase
MGTAASYCTGGLMDFNTKKQGEDYNTFYRRGGGTYNLEQEANFLRYRVLQPLAIRRGGLVLELGCGLGIHAYAFQAFGLQVTAIDISAEAIRQARSRYRGPHFVHADAASFLNECSPRTNDLVFARGMSWFHYDLEGEVNRHGINVRKLSQSIMHLVRPSGYFVVQVRSDFTGRWDHTGVRHHTFDQAREFFQGLGEIVMMTDWCGLPLVSEEVARASARNLLIALRPNAKRSAGRGLS